uniref:CD80-like immunoglobulin C2-set domain-containing protein n=1 Tax=Amphilophus citrinellus TaxID=61819 RepID=A0A3Q0SRN1_AMPCI
MEGGRIPFLNDSINIASLQLVNLTLADEGLYTCIHTFFPSGNVKQYICLTGIVPPTYYIKDEMPSVGDAMSPLATCKARGAKPSVGIEWDTRNIDQKLHISVNSTLHQNGTTDTISTLVGVPHQNLTGRFVQCIVKTPVFEALRFSDTYQVTPHGPVHKGSTNTVFRMHE